MCDSIFSLARFFNPRNVYNAAYSDTNRFYDNWPGEVDSNPVRRLGGRQHKILSVSKVSSYINTGTLPSHHQYQTAAVPPPTDGSEKTNYYQLSYNGLIRMPLYMLEFAAFASTAHHGIKLFANLNSIPAKFATKKLLGDNRIQKLSSSIIFNNSVAKKLGDYFTPKYKELLFTTSLSAIACIAVACINYLQNEWLYDINVESEVTPDKYTLGFCKNPSPGMAGCVKVIEDRGNLIDFFTNHLFVNVYSKTSHTQEHQEHQEHQEYQEEVY